MNINSIRAESRQNKICEIINSIKKGFSKGLSLNYETLINLICFEQRVARRTAKEYLDIALTQVEGHEIIGKGKLKEILKSNA